MKVENNPVKTRAVKRENRVSQLMEFLQSAPHPDLSESSRAKPSEGASVEFLRKLEKAMKRED